MNDRNDEDVTVIIGGGSINEKKRYYYSTNTNNSKHGSSGKNDLQQSHTDDVNMKEDSKTNFSPQSETSHLLHAIVGLDRYPNYISRWNYNLLQDTQRLESALEEQLQKVREQKHYLLQRNQYVQSLIEEAKEASMLAVQQNKEEESNDENDDVVDWDILNEPKSWDELVENVLDAKCTEALFQSKQFRMKDKMPSISDVLEGNIQIELDASQCANWLDEEMYDVYSFPVLQPSFCIKLKRLIKNLIEFQKQKLQSIQNFQSVNDDEVLVTNAIVLGTRPIDIDMLGASWINNLLFHAIIRPLSRHLFQSTESLGELDWRQGYVVGYSSKPIGKNGIQRQRLVPHTDDSEVTLNIGMGENFDGGELAFHGLRNSDTEGNNLGEFHPIIGTALLHAGRHLHEVKDVTNGNRYGLILWARSWGGIRKRQCPCCWLNRRQNVVNSNFSASKSFCICGRQWN